MDNGVEIAEKVKQKIRKNGSFAVAAKRSYELASALNCVAAVLESYDEHNRLHNRYSTIPVPAKDIPVNQPDYIIAINEYYNAYKNILKYSYLENPDRKKIAHLLEKLYEQIEFLIVWKQ